MTKKKRNIIIITAGVVLLLAVAALVTTLIIAKNTADSVLTEETVYNDDGTIHLIAYRDKDGNLVKHTNYDYKTDSVTGEKTNLVLYFDGANDDDDVLYRYEKTVLDAEDNPLSYVMQENGETVKEITYEYFDNGGLWIMTEKTYDDEGEHAVKTIYNEDGTVKSHTTYLNDEEV